MPEWVHVWFWIRFLRAQRVETPLPQSDWRNPQTMSMQEYEFLRLEWVAAGAPHATPAAIVGAMVGAPSLRVEKQEDPFAEPVPF